MNPTGVRFDGATGLVPAVIQDADSRSVLMLGYMNAESIQLSIDTGEVHFWSRSRAEIWRKGATSGNTFQMVGIDHDCDADALLITVIPAGPACHTGTTSCFDSGAATGDISSNQSPVVLAELWRVIADRVSNPIEGSYTVDLLSRGVDGISRKVIEEATEVLLAARDHSDGKPAEALYEESADLVYHLLVLLAERGLDPTGLYEVLAARAS